jgi:ribosomal protein S18 acetylase RimI-like enzyme
MNGPKDVEIERADAAAVGALLQLFAEHRELSGYAEAAIADPMGCVFVARVDGNLAGAVVTRPVVSADRSLRGGIDELLVAQQYRGQHVGRKLMNAAEDHWKREPAAIGMQLTVVDGNEAAQSLYASMGYTVVQRRVRMWKNWS